MVKSELEKENRGEILWYSYQVKDEFQNKIISGQFASGDKFYTGAELIAMYDVSSITVVRALNDLAKDGQALSANKVKVLSLTCLQAQILVEFSDVEILKQKTIKLLSFFYLVKNKSIFR